MTLLSRCGCLFLLVFASITARAGDVTWYDASTTPRPAGALLTNNVGYWGPKIPTAVTYSYPIPPTKPADVVPRDTSKFGNRLLDGQPAGDGNSTVGMTREPLVVDFDFQQIVTLNQISVAQWKGEGLHQAMVEVKATTGDPWAQVVSVRSAGKLHHFILPKPTQARFVRLTLKAEDVITYISQVWMWGDAKPVILPTATTLPADGTILSSERLNSWRQRTGFGDHALTWQVASPWDTLTRNPLEKDFLPHKSALRQPLTLTVTRQEGESGAIFLINANERPQDLTVHLSDFTDDQGRPVTTIKATLYVAGAINTRRWGQTLRPLFSETNKLGAADMERYLTNARAIKDFPMLHLAPRGTALLWVTTQTENSAPGMYTATLTAGPNRIPIRVQVLSLTMPRPDRWVRFWGGEPASTRGPWSDADAVRRELVYQFQSLGVSEISGWPESGSYRATARQIFESDGRPLCYRIRDGVSFFLKLKGSDKFDPSNVGNEFKTQIRKEIQEMVAHATKLNIPYDHWSVELWDEPGPDSMKRWVAIAGIIKETDAKVRIYMNPLFWTREGDNPTPGFSSDQRQVDSLAGWYNKLVDISVPILGQVDIEKYPQANKEFYNYLPRLVRAYYIHPCPGRMASWEAFLRDYNGWGFYAYYAPRGDAWDDFDGGREFDYQIVYPGPDGFVPTIESESMRESWDDYCLLTLMREKGKTADLSHIMDAYRNRFFRLPDNQTPLDRDQLSQRYNDLLPQLRDQALKCLTSGR